MASANNIPQPNPFNTTTGDGYNPNNGDGSQGVEFCTPSITSQNFDEVLGESLANAYTSVINSPITALNNANYNPHLKYIDLIRHGYFVLDIKADSAQADYFYMQSIVTPSTTEQWRRGIITKNTTNRISNNNTMQQAAPKAIQDTPAPTPSVLTTSTRDLSEAVIFTLYPNPTTNTIHINYGLIKATQTQIYITNIEGKTVRTLTIPQRQTAGIYDINDYFVGDLTAGIYFLNIQIENNIVSRKIIIQK